MVCHSPYLLKDATQMDISHLSIEKPISKIVVKFCLCFLHGHALFSSIYVGLLSLIAINDRTL